MVTKPVVYFVFDVTDQGTRGIHRPVALSYTEDAAYAEVKRRQEDQLEYAKNLVYYQPAHITVDIL